MSPTYTTYTRSGARGRMHTRGAHLGSRAFEQELTSRAQALGLLAEESAPPPPPPTPALPTTRSAPTAPRVGRTPPAAPPPRVGSSATAPVFGQPAPRRAPPSVSQVPTMPLHSQGAPSGGHAGEGAPAVLVEPLASDAERWEQWNALAGARGLAYPEEWRADTTQAEMLDGALLPALRLVGAYALGVSGAALEAYRVASVYPEPERIRAKLLRDWPDERHSWCEYPTFTRYMLAAAWYRLSEEERAAIMDYCATGKPYMVAQATPLSAW